MGQDELVQIMRSNDSMSDVGEYCHETLRYPFRDFLRFEQSTTDFGFNIKSGAHKLAALATTNVDDMLSAATPEMFNAFRKESRERFDVNL